MNSEGYARAFARALYGAAAALRDRSEVTRDVLALRQQWDGSPELRLFCRSRQRGSADERAAFVGRLWGDSLARTTSAFLMMLARRHQLAMLPSVVRQYQALDDRARGCSEVRIGFACEPDDGQVDQIRRLVAAAYGPLMNVHVKVVPELIAGVRFSVNDKRVDATLAGRLARLRAGLLKPMQLDAPGA
jgi:F-type H+-transporting ATPase subunit delta